MIGSSHTIGLLFILLARFEQCHLYNLKKALSVVSHDILL